MKAQPWIPTTNIKDLRHIGKLGEEVNELGTVINRIVIQQITGIIPNEEKDNKKWLEEEIADVLTLIDLNIKHFNLDIEFINNRIKKKTDFVTPWLNGELDEDICM